MPRKVARTATPSRRRTSWSVWPRVTGREDLLVLVRRWGCLAVCTAGLCRLGALKKALE